MSRFQTAILDGPVSLADWSPQVVQTAQRGAIASFIGVVRDHTRGRQVVELTYESYRPMAERMLQDLCSETAQRFDPDLAVAIAHGTGRIAPGEIAVIIHAASAHRRPALDAASHLIERIKEDLPVWKCERFADGSQQWAKGS